MARKKKTEAEVTEAPAATVDVSGLITQACQILGDQAQARNALDDAKEQVIESMDGIRNFAKFIAGVNEDLDQFAETADGKKVKAAKVFADGVADQLYASGVKQRASELLTLTETRASLPRIVEGVDDMLAKMRVKDPKASLNLRTEVLALARAVRNAKRAEAKGEPAQSIASLIEERRKRKMHVPQDEERIKKLLEKLAAEDLLNNKVGDDRALKKAARGAIAVLWAMAEGREPEANNELPEPQPDEPQAPEQEKPEEIESEPETPPEAPSAPEAPQPAPAPTPTQQPAPAAPEEGVSLGMGVDELLDMGKSVKG